MPAPTPRPRPNRREMRLEELRLLSQMLALTTADASVHAVLERAARNAAHLTSASRASIATPSVVKDRWRFAAEWDSVSGEAAVLGVEISAGPGSLVHRALTEREPTHVLGDALVAEMTGLSTSRASVVRMRSVLLVPMVANEQVEGILTVSRPKRKQKFSKHDITLAVAIADHAALAIQAARAIERERRERRREQLLARVALLGFKPGTHIDVGREAVPLVREAVSADWCAIYVPAPKGRTVELVISDGIQDAGADALARRAVGLAPHAVPLIGRCLLMDAPLVVTAAPALIAEASFLFPDPADEPVRRAWRGGALFTWAAVPLALGDATTGVLAVGRRAAVTFLSGDLEFLKTAGRALGAAMGHAVTTSRV